MWASKNCVQPGETVSLRATATNRGNRTQVIEVKDKPVLDIIVDFTKSTAKGVTRWSDGKPLTPELTRLELKPGESKSIEMGWNPDQSAYGPVGVNALFVDSEKPGGAAPSVLINVRTCPGPLGP